MKRSLVQMSTEFREHWKNYVLQSVLATLALLGALYAQRWAAGALSIRGAVIVASIGATAFIVFATPSAVTAKPRRVVGGHLVGLACGALCSWLVVAESPYALVAYAGAVGFAMFMMVIADVEHPPAAGTALGIAIAGCTWRFAAALVTSIVLLALAHFLLRRWLRDLV